MFKWDSILFIIDFVSYVPGLSFLCLRGRKGGISCAVRRFCFVLEGEEGGLCNGWACDFPGGLF